MAGNMKVKRKGLALEIRTFVGKNETYVVFRTASGSYHAFAEVEAKQAAKDCGATKSAGSTQTQWKEVWDRADADRDS
jgi:hypothetical protein